MENLTISLSEKELQIIIQGLGKLTAEQSFSTILKLQAAYAGHISSKNKQEVLESEVADTQKNEN